MGIPGQTYMPTDLREGYVKFYEKNQCDLIVGSNISNTQYCFGDIENGVDTCQGDSGGPVICDYGSRSIAIGKDYFVKVNYQKNRDHFIRTSLWYSWGVYSTGSIH